MKKILILVILINSAVFSQKTLYDFGVKGDGSDETKFIQKAIDKSTGKTLVVPKGNFLCKDLIASDKITIAGEDGSSIKLHSLRVDSKNTVTIKNVIFEGDNTYAKSTTLLQIQSCYDVIIERCTFKENFAEAIALNNSSNCKIMNNRIVNTDVGVLTNGNCSNLEISYNSISGGTSDGVAIFGKEGVVDSNIIVFGNRVADKVHGNGYLNWWAKNVEFTSNYAENCSHGFGTNETTYSPSYLKVTGNTFKNCFVGIDAALNNSVISGNRIDSTTAYGIWIGSQLNNPQNTYNVEVSKNIVSNATDGIRLVLAKNSTVSANIVTDTRAVKITYAGVSVMAGRDNSVSNNICLDAIIPYHVSSAINTRLSGNRGRVLDQGVGTKLN